MKNFLYILFLLYFLPLTSFAADISFDSKKNNFANNESFLVEVVVNTEDESINAIAGEVLFPVDLLELKEIRDGNSSVNFWIEKPHNETGNKIVFSGITTGGFSGQRVFLFGLVFSAKQLGKSSIIFEKIQILQNDGLGTKISIKENPFKFSIVKGNNTGDIADLTIEDKDIPEDFTPFVAHDEEIFEGKNFVVFSTVDKGVGVDHYEIREKSSLFGGKYVIAESPHLLKGQKLMNNIYVKAVDKNGNERIVKINPLNKLVYLVQALIFGIIIIVCIAIFKKR